MSRKICVHPSSSIEECHLVLAVIIFCTKLRSLCTQYLHVQYLRWLCPYLTQDKYGNQDENLGTFVNIGLQCQPRWEERKRRLLCAATTLTPVFSISTIFQQLQHIRKQLNWYWISLSLTRDEDWIRFVL